MALDLLFAQPLMVLDTHWLHDSDHMTCVGTPAKEEVEGLLALLDSLETASENIVVIMLLIAQSLTLLDFDFTSCLNSVKCQLFCSPYPFILLLATAV